MTKDKSWRVEVQADRTRQWSSNGLRFASQKDAQSYGRDLYARWTAVQAWRVSETADPATHHWVDGQGAAALPDPALVGDAPPLKRRGRT